MLDSGGTEGGSPHLMQALQAQAQHKAQANHAPGGQTPNLGGHGGAPSSTSHAATPHAPAPHTAEPREVGSIAEELVARPLQDFGAEVKSWFDINAWFGINSTDTPEEKQHKQAMLSRYQQLTGEQQQYFQKRLQAEHQRKEEQHQEKIAAEQRKQAEASAGLPPPTSVRKGPGSDMQQSTKSRSQMMTNTVAQNRQSFNKLQSSG